MSVPLIKGSQNTVSRNLPTGQLTYERQEYILIPLSLSPHFHQLITLCQGEVRKQRLSRAVRAERDAGV